MQAAGVIGITRVVMHPKEHLAALTPSGAALVLNTLRSANESRPVDALRLPAAGGAAAVLKAVDLEMAAQLIADTTAPWRAQACADQFDVAFQTLVDKQPAAGATATVTPFGQDTRSAGPSTVVDRTELLARSLAKRGPEAAAEPDASAAGRAPDKPGPTPKGAAKPTARKRTWRRSGGEPTHSSRRGTRNR